MAKGRSRGQQEHKLAKPASSSSSFGFWRAEAHSERETQTHYNEPFWEQTERGRGERERKIFLSCYTFTESQSVVGELSEEKEGLSKKSPFEEIFVCVILKCVLLWGWWPYRVSLLSPSCFEKTCLYPFEGALYIELSTNFVELQSRGNWD